MGACFSSPRDPYRVADTGAGGSPSRAPVTVTAGPILHTDAVLGVAAAGAFSELLTCSSDKTLTRYDWQTGQLLDRWTHEHAVNRVVWDPSSGTAFSASRDKTVRQWRPGHAEPVQCFRGHDLVVTAVSPRPDGRWLASGSRDYAFRVWDVATGASLHATALQLNVITALAWVPDSDTVVQAGEDLTMRLWDARVGQVAQAFPATRCFPVPACVGRVGRVCPVVCVCE